MFDLDPISILMRLPGVLIALVIHEFAHAFVADKLGDSTPRLQGKLTISPMAHVDPIGLILFSIMGFGWAKPVSVNPSNFRHPRRDDAIVSAAGPVANLLIAIIVAIVMRILFIANILSINDLYAGSGLRYNLATILILTISLNVVLFVLNLIPIPPFDGSYILENLTNIGQTELYFNLKRYSTIVLIIIIATPIARYIIKPPSDFIFSTIIIPILGIR